MLPLSVNQFSPKDVQLRPDGVYILWSDDHQSFYGHRYLRSQCPCAHCVSEITGKRMISLQEVRSDVQAMDWIQVGRYAVQFLWSDAHSTGIYPFTLLRALCQCEQCKRARSQTPG